MKFEAAVAGLASEGLALVAGSAFASCLFSLFLSSSRR